MKNTIDIVGWKYVVYFEKEKRIKCLDCNKNNILSGQLFTHHHIIIIIIKLEFKTHCQKVLSNLQKKILFKLIFTAAILSASIYTQ